MELVHERCAGLDVHQRRVVACARYVEGRRVVHDVATFETTTPELLRLAEWLAARGITHVAMESTGVFWRPVWHLLEARFTLLLANAQHVRAIPGRKSDVNDATWLADLLAHGLIRGSFVPPVPIQALRDLTRTRTQLVREVNRHTLRIHRVLQDANLKLTSVISDLLGVSGRAILDALVGGETEPARLAAATTGRLQVARPALLAALTGHVTAHHRFLLRLHLGQIDALRAAIRAVEGQLEEHLRPFRDALERLTAMPGISTTVARVILAEVGPDLTRFATAGHLISWAGLCPRLDESAGKRLSTRTRPGAPWLKTALVQAAWGAVRCRDSYFHAQFLRLKSRRGPKKAVVAVAASLLTAAYHVLRGGIPYRDLGADYFVQRHTAQIARRLVQRLRDLGLEVAVHPAPA